MNEEHVNEERRAAVDPVTLSVLWNALVSVADDMGTTLRHTAYSAAVREGDDFSTGLFDARGRLVAQGNFSPGHLGSGVGVAPLWWTPDHRAEEVSGWRKDEHRTRRSTGVRWWSWCGLVARPGSSLASSGADEGESRCLSR